MSRSSIRIIRNLNFKNIQRAKQASNYVISLFLLFSSLKQKILKYSFQVKVKGKSLGNIKDYSKAKKFRRYHKIQIKHAVIQQLLAKQFLTPLTRQINFIIYSFYIHQDQISTLAEVNAKQNQQHQRYLLNGRRNVYRSFQNLDQDKELINSVLYIFH